MPMPFSILSIDDDLSVRKSMFYMFKDLYPFFEAENGQKAFEILKKETIDLIFLDLNFPNGENGLELLRDILTLNPDVDIIILTANTDLSKAVECIRAGAIDFIAKPVEVDQVRARVGSLANKKRINYQKLFARVKTSTAKPWEVCGWRQNHSRHEKKY